MKTLLNNAPGTAIIGKIDKIKEVTPKGYMSGPLQILEYVKTLKENRTGLSDPAQGVPDPVNQTAQGMQLIYSASMQRLELIARIFAETGLSDLYRKFAMLYQKYLRKPFTTEMFGDSRQVTPQMLRGKVIVTVNMGVAANIGMQEAAKVAQVIGFLQGMEERFPGLLSPEKIHNISRKYITSMGFRDVDDFMNDMKTYVGEYKQRIESQQKEKERMIGLQKQMDEMDRMLKNKEIDTKAALEGQRIKAEDVFDQRKYDVGIKRIESQQEKTSTDAQVAVVGEQIKSVSESDKTEAQREKAFMDNINTKIKLMLESQKIQVMKDKKSD
jgi:hypothetical protein